MSIFQSVKDLFDKFLGQPKSMQQRVIDRVRKEDPEVARELERFRNMKQQSRETEKEVDRLLQKMREK